MATHTYRVPKKWPIIGKQLAPYQFCGLDYMGPYSVKMPDGKVQKIWVPFWTCFVVRTIFMDIVLDQITSEFIMSLRRFFAAKRVPEEMLSDQCSTLKSGKEVLDSAWAHIADPDTQAFLANENITWKHTTECVCGLFRVGEMPKTLCPQCSTHIHEFICHGNDILEAIAVWLSF